MKSRFVESQMASIPDYRDCIVNIEQGIIQLKDGSPVSVKQDNKGYDVVTLTFRGTAAKLRVDVLVYSACHKRDISDILYLINEEGYALVHSDGFKHNNRYNNLNLVSKSMRDNAFTDAMHKGIDSFFNK